VGLYGLVLVVSFGFMIIGASELGGDNLERVRIATLALVMIGSGVLAFLVFGGRIVDRWMLRLSEVAKVGRLFVHIAGPLRMFHHHKLPLAVAILMSCGVHLGLAISIYMIAHGLYRDAPTLLEHAVMVPIGLLASALPIAPAGLGVFEAAMEWVYKVIPVPPTQASGTLVALTFEIVKLLTAVIGVLFYWTASDEVRQSIEEAETEQPLTDNVHST
jgi:hypothetical protein